MSLWPHVIGYYSIATYINDAMAMPCNKDSLDRVAVLQQFCLEICSFVLGCVSELAVFTLGM